MESSYCDSRFLILCLEINSMLSISHPWYISTLPSLADRGRYVLDGQPRNGVWKHQSEILSVMHLCIRACRLGWALIILLSLGARGWNRRTGLPSRACLVSIFPLAPSLLVYVVHLILSLLFFIFLMLYWCFFLKIISSPVFPVLFPLSIFFMQRTKTR